MIKTNLPNKAGKTKEIIISLDFKLYPLEAIYNTAYNFIDRAYLFLDTKGNPIEKITIAIKPKSAETKFNLADLKKEFFNELLDNVLRYQIAKENKTIREFIVGTALLGSLKKLNPSEEFFTDVESLIKELAQTTPNEEGEDKKMIEDEENIEEEREISEKDLTFKDPLGIAIPWEEKFQPKKQKCQKRNK